MKMRQRKVPSRLEDAALDALANYIGTTMSHLFQNPNSKIFQTGVQLLREDICDMILPQYYSKFAMKILQILSEGVDQLLIDVRQRSNGTDWMDLVINEKLDHLELYPGVSDRLMSLIWTKVHSSFHRLRNLRSLHLAHSSVEWSYSNWIRSTGFATNLKLFQMDRLTVFVYPRYCTDQLLSLLVANAPRLVVLDVHESPLITSRGIPVLRKCPNLSLVNFRGCAGITPSSIDQLLSSKLKIRSLELGEQQSRILHNYPRHGTVYPYVEHLVLECSTIGLQSLEYLVKMFPNLVSVDLRANRCSDIGRLAALKLSHLHVRGLSTTKWKPLLTDIGHSLTSFGTHGEIEARDLDFVRKACPNLRAFEATVRCDAERFVIPAFEKLERLTISSTRTASNGNRSTWSYPKLLFLEHLDYDCASLCSDHLETILMDCYHFPRLKSIVARNANRLNVKRLEKIARVNNFDVHISDGKRTVMR